MDKFIETEIDNFPTFEEIRKLCPFASKEEIEQYFKERKSSKIYVNSRYQVVLTKNDVVTHLSIKRLDREAIHDWRDLQEIKNQLLGEEIEAVELYPAESRLVDMANQYHLWAIDDFKFPFGFGNRIVIDGDGSLTESNIKQRPFKK